MNKLKTSVAVQRQIPEHIRENYPVFVEFVKLYYEFLDQSQRQELESIRDIDTTLDEFIDRFKSELAKNIPVDLAQDKRLLLKHIREFYLSRGSESSYKFLFRVLFGKEATLYYPSTQILRVSDGKWKQDVSIFVKYTGTTTDLSALNGQFAKIKTSRKTIQTFVENVLQYNQNIFEVFIQRDYANEIEVGSEVSCTVGSTTYTGVIVKCPSKISVYKSGKGFKVGDLYALKTNIGRGCVVKITKVNSEGAIQAVQVVRFGLDYQTKFYSYLSSKEIQAFEYFHPVNLVQGTPENPATAPGYDPADDHYNEPHGGFVDWGFANKQTYMYYDEEISVATADRASDRFFADPSYVGDIEQQFYNNSDKLIMDEDLAIIEIELGAVARYPGYYLKADGFISDEMYIHDGKYYQAFSYVIRVEEELRKYADIVKALVHPAGMKAYSEYSIFKHIDVNASIPSLSQILQFSETPITIDDRGYSWNAYELQQINGQDVLMPAQGAAKVYSRQGKAALLTDKNFTDTVQQFTDSKYYILDKNIAEVIDYVTTKSKAFTKNTQDSISEYVEFIEKAYAKQLADAVSNSDSNSKLIESIKQDIQLILDSESYAMVKNVSDTTDQPTDSYNLSFFKNIVESVLNDDPRYSEVAKAISDIFSTADLPSNNLEKIFSDNFSLTDSERAAFEKYIYESISQPDSLINELFKTLADTISGFDSYINNLNKNQSEFISITDLLSNNPQKYFDESLSLTEVLIIARAKILEDTMSVIDQFLGQLFEKAISETLTLSEASTKDYDKQHVETITIGELYETLYSKVLTEVIGSISDVYSNQLAKSYSETIDLSEAKVYSNSKANSETINILLRGRLRLSPYDGEGYFSVFDDYQPATTLS